MRKSAIIAALVAVVIFGVGYAIGQVRGATPGSAAGQAPLQLSGALAFDGFGFHGMFGGPHAAGTVTAISGDTLTIKPFTGPRGQSSAVTTVLVSSTTKYVSRPTTAASQSSVKVGTFIVATGTLSSDGKTLTAQEVMILPHGLKSGGLGHLGPDAGGQVTAVNGATITVKPFANRDGAQSAVTTILLTGSTQYLAPKGGATAAKSAIKVGVYIRAEGTLSADGKSLTASRVEILPNAPGAGGFMRHGPGVLGQVTAINGNTIAIKPGMNRDGVAGTVTAVVVTASTAYSTGPGTTAGKDAVKVGSYIVARGTLSSDGKTLTATKVLVLPGAPQ